VFSPDAFEKFIFIMAKKDKNAPSEMVLQNCLRQQLKSMLRHMYLKK